MKAQISALRNRSTNSDGMLEQLKRDVSMAKRRFDEAKSELEALESESVTLQKAEQTVKDELDSLRMQEKGLRSQISDARLASSDLSMKKLNAEREMDGLNATITKLQKELAERRSQNEKDRQALAIMTEGNQKKKAEKETLEREITKASVQSRAPPVPQDDFATGFDPFADMAPAKDAASKEPSPSKVQTAAPSQLPALATTLGALSSNRSIGSDSSSGMEPPPLPPDPFPGEGDPFAQTPEPFEKTSPPDDPFASENAAVVSDPEPPKEPPADPFDFSNSDPFATSDKPPDVVDPFAAANSEKPPEKVDPFAQSSGPKENLKPEDPFAVDASPSPNEPPPEDPFDSSFDPFASMDAAMAKSDPFASSAPAPMMDVVAENPAPVQAFEEEVQAADDFSLDPFAGAEDPVDIDETDPFAAFDDDLDEEFPEEDFT